MLESEADREARLRELAAKLLFRLDKQGLRFALYRDVDVSMLMSRSPSAVTA
jgi:hypothetical protein